MKEKTTFFTIFDKSLVCNFRQAHNSCDKNHVFFLSKVALWDLHYKRAKDVKALYSIHDPSLKGSEQQNIGGPVPSR